MPAEKNKSGKKSKYLVLFWGAWGQELNSDCESLAGQFVQWQNIKQHKLLTN